MKKNYWRMLKAVLICSLIMSVTLIWGWASPAPAQPVRIAVGAGAKEIRQLVVREGNILALLGIAIGLLITAKNAAFVRAFVFNDDDRWDSRVFAVVCVVIFAAAWLASYLPARRAMKINPVEALRND